MIAKSAADRRAPLEAATQKNIARIHDRTGNDPPGARGLLPFHGRRVCVHVSHAEASNLPADRLSVNDRRISRAVVAHRTFDGKLTRIMINNDKNKAAA